MLLNKILKTHSGLKFNKFPADEATLPELRHSLSRSWS